MKFRAWFIAFLSVSFLNVSYGKTFQIGEQHLEITPVPGFVNASLLNSDALGRLSHFTPEQMQLLAMYVEREDAEKMVTDEELQIQKYFVLATPKNMTKMSVTPMLFSIFKERTKKEIDTISPKIREKIAKKEKIASKMLSTPDVSVQYKTEKVIPLGVDFENDFMLLYSALLTGTININGEAYPWTKTCSNAVILVNDKLLCLNVYNDYEKHDDLVWTQTKVREFAEKILKENAPSSSLNNNLLSGNVYSTFTHNLLKEKTSHYSTLDHPKALGLDVLLDYPESWQRKEGKRPHIVQVFNAPENQGSVSCIIMIRSMPEMTPERIKDITVADFTTGELRDELLAMGGTLGRHGMTVLDGEKTFGFESILKVERAGIKLEARYLSYWILFNQKLIAISFFVGGQMGDSQMQVLYNAYLPLFQKIINSIVINSKWK